MSPVKQLLFLLLFMAAPAWADTGIPECRSWEEALTTEFDPGPWKQGLLWKIERQDVEASYIFGTIHVADERVTALPELVTRRVAAARIFAMEVVPKPEEVLAFSRLMYFADERRLKTLISGELYSRVENLLSAYHLAPEAVEQMKPWAAFLTLSYPAEFGKVLDLQLLELARANGVRISGLETLSEQVGVFENMAMHKQLRLLADTVCHYHIMEADFEKMKSLYMARDLSGLYSYAQRYAREDDDLYNELVDSLLTRRNDIMTRRIEPLLSKGNAFIAVGAMHLAGEQGILSQLVARDFIISRVY